MVVPVVEILRPIFHADFLIGVGRDRSQLNDPALEMQPATLDPEKNLGSGIRGGACGDGVSDGDLGARHRRQAHHSRCEAETRHGRSCKDLDRTRCHRFVSDRKGQAGFVPGNAVANDLV